MKLDDLIKAGGVVDTTLIKKTKDWTRADKNGEEVTDEISFFVRRASHAMFKQAYMEAGKEAGVGAKVDEHSALIVAHIRLGENGEEVLTYEQAFGLETNLSMLFIEGINELYEGADPKKTSRPKKSSGAS